MITIYRTFYDQTPYYLPIDKALERIRNGKSKQLVKACQEVYNDPKQYAAAKRKLPCILFSGQFAKRAISGLITHSGYICLDFDKFPNEDELILWRDNLEGDEYTYCVFLSPSDRGLKCIVKIPPVDYKDHKALFRGLQKYYNCEYFDFNVFDISRICFESFDHELQINISSKIWDTAIFDPEPIIIPYNKASLSEHETVRRLLLWADRKFPIVAGARNSNLFKLCCSLNDFGINYDHAHSVVSQFKSDDFKLMEIETTLKSAYRKTGKFGSLKF